MRRRTLSRAIQTRLQKYKHIVDFNFQNVDGFSAVQTGTIVIAADNPLIANTTNVITRARVKAVYLEMTFQNVTVRRVYQWMLAINPQGSFTSPNPATSGSSTQKNYIIKQGTLAVDPTGQGPASATVRGLIKIPPKYQRFMIGDILYLAWSAQFNGASATDNVLAKFIYKEVRG